MATKITPVIMAGGSGTRLWPLSRKLFPKQFLPLVSQETMLQDTLGRVDPTLSNDDIAFTDSIIVCNEEHRFIVAEQLRSANQTAKSIILEPIGRNTAPAVALAALEAMKDDEGAMLLVLAADHLIKNRKVFLESVVKAAEIAEDGKLSTFGIVPSAPETGYGYIEAGDLQNGAGAVKKFVEKPNLETAQRYLDAGCFYWNSGMFMFKAKIYIEELTKFRPDILESVTKAYEGKSEDLDFLRVDKAAFEACPDDSIDYAIMEKTDKAMVVPMDAGWSDIGSWSSLWEQSDKDESGNVCHGDVLNLNSNNCLVHTTHKLVATVGVDDLMIVNTPDALLVSAKDQVQDVKKVVDALKQERRGEALLHREVARPWGSYDSIDMGERFQVKRITVKPGGKLSLQMHHHRAEHWIVVSGSAKVTVGDETQLLSENQSTYIPIGVTHRLENPGVVPLEMIEVQSGSYLGEDDIVRFEDTYGRS